MAWSNWHLGWPWLCLGGGLVLFSVMFGTNALRGHATGSRWWDPVWLAWLAGLLIFNGTLHVVAALAAGAAGAGGVLTGGLLFIPSFFWMSSVRLSGVRDRP